MEKPIVLVIMDGVGKGDGGSGDAVKVAKTPTCICCTYTFIQSVRINNTTTRFF